jgi:hypothetical protein
VLGGLARELRLGQSTNGTNDNRSDHVNRRSKHSPHRCRADEQFGRHHNHRVDHHHNRGCDNRANDHARGDHNRSADHNDPGADDNRRRARDVAADNDAETNTCTDDAVGLGCRRSASTGLER